MKKSMSRREALRWFALTGAASLLAAYRPLSRSSARLIDQRPPPTTQRLLHLIRLTWPQYMERTRQPLLKLLCGQLAGSNALSRMASM